MSIYPAVITQPGMASLSPHLRTQWSSDICDLCQDMEICCVGCWCPCWLMSRTSTEFGECLCLPLMDSFCGGIARPISLSMRSAIRERYNIQGTVCDDCFTTSCLTMCAWCQMARELKRHREPLILAASAPMSPPPYHIPPIQPMPTAPYPMLPQQPPLLDSAKSNQ